MKELQPPEVRNALKINIVLAKATVSEGLALHPRDRRRQSRSRSRSRAPPRRSRSPPEHKLRWQIFSDKPNGGHTCVESELKRFMGSLLCFVYGQSDELGAVLREFCLDPGMGDVQ